MPYLLINNKNYSICKNLAEQWERELFPTGKAKRAWCSHSLQSSAEVKKG